jgi:hypothetical protein
MMANDILFEVATPLGFGVRVTRVYWELIVTVKHPVMHGREAEVQRVLQTPEEVRRSRGDPTVLLFYRSEHSCPLKRIFASGPGFDDSLIPRSP